ncbi:MAG TPA: HAD-IC family P-type ATPase, partial [Roseiflexaceae bacterium]|nr:HAD-IC family P-type ATPase [Roseiflexaceae bacterium]
MTEPSAPQSIVAYQHPAEHVVAELDTNASSGLTQAEAQRRLQQYGLNQLETAKAVPWWQLLLEQFRDTLVIILLIATVISFVEWFLQNPKETPLPYEGLVILSIVILNALLGYFQEARAERAVQALMEMAAPESTVIRDGQRLRVPSHDLVPGDILLLEAGDRIPADARLLESANFKVDEAALTGESLPASKTTAMVKGEASLGDRVNMVFAGTVATYGRGRAAVVATGMRTEVGRIASLIEGATKEATPLQQELDRTGKRLTVIMLVICAVVFVTSILIQGARDLASILQLFLFAVALAVAAIPEALPAVVTAGLAIGVRRMAAANALIRKLPAVETLGAASVICTDKTGTLTRNEMTVRKVFTADTVVDVSGSGYNPKGEFTIGSQPVAELPAPVRIDLEKTLRAGALANDANLRHDGERWLVQGDPTEGALVVAAQKYGLPERE